MAIKRLGEMYSKLEIAAASDLLDTIVPLEPFRNEAHSFEGMGESYDSSFNGSLMRNGVYCNCDFVNINFYGTVGDNSIIENSELNDCTVENANFKYSNFANSKFRIKSRASTYDFSDFSNATISESIFESSSFTECYFRNSTIVKSQISQCEFRNSIFYNTTFENLDLSKVTFDYSEFDKSTFKNVVLPFFGILNLVSGFEQILEQKGVLFKPSTSNYIVTSEKYIEDIRALTPIFLEEKNFIALANIFTYDGEIQNAYLAILEGLKQACKKKNFTLMRHLCRFASINKYFNNEQLKEFYVFIDTSFNVKDMGYVAYHNYLNELSLAKKLLIDCPFNKDVMEISLKATFDYRDERKLTQTYKLINSTIEKYAPDSNNYITLRHNSPPDITIIVSDNIYLLFLLFFALQLIFCKTLNGIEKVQTLIKNKHEIKLQKLEEELKRLEIEKLKMELNSEYS